MKYKKTKKKKLSDNLQKNIRTPIPILLLTVNVFIFLNIKCCSMHLFKGIFKNLIISYDNMNSISVNTSLSSFTNINYEIESYELENISISKISDFIVENILSKYITSLSQITKNNIKIIMDDVFDKYRKGYILLKN